MGAGYERIIKGRNDPWHDQEVATPIQVGTEGERISSCKSMLALHKGRRAC